MSYNGNGTAPYVVGSDTSTQAAEEIESSAAALRTQIHSMIQSGGAWGATCDEVEVWLSMRHQTASARIRELVLSGHLTDSGYRRLTRSRRQAVVWIVPLWNPFGSGYGAGNI